jgi:glycosyltransferase involved in cell wall biosynthesis
MYHGNLAAHAARLLGRLSGPVLWNIRGTHTTLANESISTALTIWLGAKLSRHAHTVVNNSAVSMRMHIERLGYFKGNVAVIPNGFDTDRFHPDKEARSVLADRLRLDPQCRLVGHIARLHPMKDHTSLLRAAALLLDGRANTHFVLVGEGVTDSSVIAGLADALGIRDRVHFLGSLGDVSAFLPALDLVVLTSAYGEGFSNAIGEAMACGVPCVVTDVGDSAWIVGDSGEVVAPQDVAAIAKSIEKLLSLPRENLHAMGERARERIVKNFSIAAIASQYEDLYSRAAQQIA